MENPLVPTTSLTLGGTTYKLCFDLAALLRVEKETGKNMLAALGIGEWNLTLVMAAFHAALLRFQPDVDFVALSASLTRKEMLDATGAMFEAYDLATALDAAETDESDGSEKNEPAPESAGATSGDSPAIALVSATASSGS